jgi:hypothetical protein
MNLKTIFFLVLLISFSGWSQIQIKGIVLEKSSKDPLPGVIIVEKNTKNGTQSDYDGNFTITVADENAILVFTFIGIQTKEVKIENQTNLKVNLKEECHKDWFDTNRIGFYINSGVINNPLGGSVKIAFPAMNFPRTLTSEMSYQTDTNDNQFINASLNFLHLFYNCNFDTDINTYYQNLQYEKKIDLEKYSIETSLNFNRIRGTIGYSLIDFSNLDKKKEVESSGLILGLQTWIGQPFLVTISWKTSFYNELIDYQVDLNKRYKNFYGFIKYYQIDDFNELSLGFGIELIYRLKKQRNNN